MTGVKGFQFKHRAAYELRVYVDDGSIISEILIDHRVSYKLDFRCIDTFSLSETNVFANCYVLQVVQSAIGHSPEEVTAALTSSDTKRVSYMRETMKQFQVFLANFEVINCTFY